MTAMRRRFLKLASLLGGVALLWACNAPFIPVPPPGATFTSALVDDGAGGQKTVWTTHGLPSVHAAFATYYVYDEQTKGGIIATAAADGSFTGMPLEGTMGDHVQVRYQTPNGDYSDSTCLLLTTDVDPSTGSAPRCPP
jgi:hypothetical protein